MSTTTINSTPKATTVSAADRVQSELDVLTARLRRDVWLFGVLAITATAVGVLLATVISDAILQPESTSLRFVLWTFVLAAVAVAAYRFAWLPLRDRCNTLALAWSLEEQRPELQEGVTTTLLLADNKQPAAVALVDAVAAQANQNLASCRDDAATRCDIQMPAIAAASCVMVAAFCFAVCPQYLMPSLSNVMAPWKTRQLPYLTATISPGDTAVAEGEALDVSALGRDLDNCVLEFMDGSDVLSSIPMTTTATGNEANVLLPELATDQTYRVRSGFLVSDEYRITVHLRPVVTAAKVWLQFPQYTGIEPETIDDLSAPIAAIPGTDIKFSVATNLLPSDTKLMYGDQRQGSSETVQADDVWWHHWNLQVDEVPVQAGRLEMISEHGVSSEPFPFEIRSLPDQPATVFIKSPTLQQLTVLPEGRLPIQFEAADDFGLQSVELLMQTGEAEPQNEVVLQNQAATSHAGEYIFDPQQHDLEVGDQLALWFVATDNRTDEYGGAQTAESRQLIITVTSDEVSVGGQQVIDEQDEISESLTDAIERLRAAKAIAQQIADAAQQADADGAKDIPAETNADAEKLQQQLQNAQEALEQAADSSNHDAGMFEAEKQQVRDIANEDVEEARQQARIIPLTSEPKQQQQAADAAREAIEQAEEQLAALQEKTTNRADKLQQAAELDELARQQNELARLLEEQDEFPQQAEPKQEQIADRLQDLVKKDPEADREQFLQRGDAAEQLVKQTNQLQEQQQQLTNATEAKTDDEIREQLARMIREEQQAVAEENQQLTEQTRQGEANSQNEQAAGDAQQLMEQATKDLDEQNLKAAEQNAKNAKQKLQEAAALNDAADEGTPQKATSEKRERLAKRQERIEDAIRAVDEDNFEAAADELQELITDRLEQVAEDAEELLTLPTDDEENQKARDEAQQKLQEALKDSKRAAGRSQDQQQAGQKNDNAAEQNQPGQQQQQQPGQQQNQDGQPQTQQQQQQPGQQQQQHPGQPQDQQQQARQKEQQNKAAESLKLATESLQQFCRSCQECSNCNKQSPEGSTSDEASRPGRKKAGSKQGNGKQGSGTKGSGTKGSGTKGSGTKGGGTKGGGTKGGGTQGGQRGQRIPGPAKLLARTTDNAQKAARKPTRGEAKQLARELDELADDAAQKSGYSKRRGDKGKAGGNKNGAQPRNAGNDKNTGGSNGSQSPSSAPNGVGLNSQPDDANTQGTQLRGQSTSEWTRSHRRLRGNVLDNKSAQIPEAYRGVVEDYFEQLSKIESDKEKSGDSK